MNCFNHQEHIAVGICKHCNKALCPECLSDLGHGIACKEHIEEVKAISLLISNNLKIHSRAPKNALITPLFFIFMGILWVIKAWIDSEVFYFEGEKYWDIAYFVLFMGAGFLLFGIIVFAINWRHYHQKENQANE